MALLTMGFAACNDDFPTEFVPQTNAPENAFPANAVSVAPSADAANDQAWECVIVTPHVPSPLAEAAKPSPNVTPTGSDRNVTVE